MPKLPEPWQQWPRSSDVRLWMQALLRLIDYMDDPDERASSTVIVAIGELARKGYPDEAFEQVEHVHRTLPIGAAFQRSSVLMTGAQISFDAGDLERMEHYLRRALELQPLFPRKCERGCQDAAVRKFRVLRGLLAPRDATSAEERIEASFNQLMRAATQATDRGDAATSVVKLIEAERLVAAMPDWRKRQVLNVLVVELSRAGGEQTLQRLLQADDTAGRKTRLSPETLVRIGHRARAISRFEDKAREALAELESGTPNAHFPAMQLERAICGLADAGEMDLANAWLDRGLDQGKSWHLMAGGAFSSAVFASIAKAVARVQGRAAALTLVKLAGEHANADRKSGWRTAAIRANAELLIELSPPEEALELARKVRSKPAKSRLLAKIFATREDWDGLHEVLNACVKPLDAAELIWWTKFVWRPYP